MGASRDETPDFIREFHGFFLRKKKVVIQVNIRLQGSTLAESIFPVNRETS
jgi:hypothetical protein